ncbi:unnamed protein product [Closterium sp. Naga37s-1]|nr:unnamed protein product [Closterium sp. Naga37s-1]
MRGGKINPQDFEGLDGKKRDPETASGASYNYLYGPVPKLGAALKTIELRNNWLSGTFPGTGFLSCSASSNCLASTGTCNTTATTQRALASCAVCNSPKGADPICAGGTCAPNTAGPLASSTTPTATSPILPRFCMGVPLDAVQAGILLSVKTALGVTLTHWSASTLGIPSKANPLSSEFSDGPRVLGRRRLAGSRSGRERLLLVASGQGGMCTIQGQTPVPGSWPGVFCSSAGMVVGLDLRSFLLRGTVHADISKLTTLTALYLSSNLFFQRLDSFVAPILPTASLKDLRFSYIYLTGSLPKPGATLKFLDTQANFLSSTFPTATLACNTRLNCFANASGCFNVDGTEQRTATECSMCGSPQTKLGLCGGGTCLPVLSPSLAKVPNSAAAPTLMMTCAAVPLDATSGEPLPFLPCCRTNVASNLLDARMSEWALPLTGLKTLKQLYLNYNWFSGPLPSFLLSMSSLTALNVCFNYLAGPITSTPSASLKSLNVASNLLTGTFPASSTTACDARSNCLADSSKCLASGSSSQRPSSDCTVCGLGGSSAVVCNGGVCTPDTTEPLAALTPNSASAALLPMQCSGVRIDTTAVSVLGSLKAALGVPLPDWGVNSLCTVAVVVSGVSTSSPHPRDLGGVLCSPAGAVVGINLNTRKLAGSMHADVSKLTALTALAFYSNFLAGRLDAFTAPFTSLSNLQSLSVPVPGTAIKHLDLENNYLVGTFPTVSLQSCSARTNCFSNAAACTADGGKGTAQRATCSICGSADGTGVLCGASGASTCQPTAASLASLATLNSPSALALPIACSLLPAMPVNSAAMAALLTHTGWAANAVCTLAGTAGTVASGSLTGVECDSAGNPVKINLQSNLFRARLEDFALRLPALTNLAVLLLDFNWFKGSLPPPLLAMTKLTCLSIAYNYLTYRVPPVSTTLKVIVLSNNFLSGTFPANSATSCVSAGNCFTSTTSCNTATEEGLTAQRATGCDICGSAGGQGMLCGGTGVCTPNAAALFTAKTANAASAAVLPMACVDLVCAAAAPIACPTDWHCQGLKCAAPAASNCIGYLCTP